MIDTTQPGVSAALAAEPSVTVKDYMGRSHRARRGAIDALARQFGVEAIRALQYEAIEASLHGKDSICVLPTGSGKSLCFQLPALMGQGLTLVVSPLKALMKDQVDALRDRDMPAALINEDVHPREIRSVMCDAQQGRLRLLYVAPERCEQPEFLTFLDRCKLRAFVIDEAHCVSVWGHEFRPSYARLIQLRVLHPSVPMHAFTATATPLVRDQIGRMLGLQPDFERVIGEFDRPSLFLSVVDRDPRDPDAQLVSVLRSFPSSLRGFVASSLDGIVYCNTRAETERVAKMLVSAGCSARAYHAGLTGEDRRATQDWFMSRSVPSCLSASLPSSKIVVATVAFGMGINKPDVRFVIHYGMPSSIDVYHQEIGRAGRDGNPAECIMLYHPDDYHRWVSIHDNDAIPDAARQGRADSLDALDAFINADGCRHANLTEYFGQTYQSRDSNGAGCGACDVCVEAKP